MENRFHLRLLKLVTEFYRDAQEAKAKAKRHGELGRTLNAHNHDGQHEAYRDAAERLERLLKQERKPK